MTPQKYFPDTKLYYILLTLCYITFSGHLTIKYSVEDLTTKIFPRHQTILHSLDTLLYYFLGTPNYKIFRRRSDHNNISPDTKLYYILLTRCYITFSGHLTIKYSVEDLTTTIFPPTPNYITFF